MNNLISIIADLYRCKNFIKTNDQKCEELVTRERVRQGSILSSTLLRKDDVIKELRNCK